MSALAWFGAIVLSLIGLGLTAALLCHLFAIAVEAVAKRERAETMRRIGMDLVQSGMWYSEDMGTMALLHDMGYEICSDGRLGHETVRRERWRKSRLSAKPKETT